MAVQEHPSTLAPTRADAIRPLLVKILLVLGGGGGSGSSSALNSGNYGGTTPNYTPSVAVQLTIDTSNGALWIWVNNEWVASGITLGL